MSPSVAPPMPPEFSIPEASPLAEAVIAGACKNGHLRTAETTFVHPTKGWRRCRICKRASTAAYKLRHRDRRRDVERLHRRESERSRYSEHPEQKAEANRRWVSKNAHRARLIQRVSAVVRRALLRGDLVRASACEECGSTEGRIEAAHRDYSMPLDVRWLCRPCHRKWDAAQPKTLAHLMGVAS